VFGAQCLDKQGFVVDFGALKQVKQQLQAWFDHTVILQADDPLVPLFRTLEKKGFMNLQTFPLISSEGLAEYCALYVNEQISMATSNRAYVISCEHIEAEKNTAIFTIPRGLDKTEFNSSLEDLIEYAKELEQANVGIRLDG